MASGGFYLWGFGQEQGHGWVVVLSSLIQGGLSCLHKTPRVMVEKNGMDSLSVPNTQISCY